MGFLPHLLHPVLPQQPGQTIHWSSLHGESIGWAIHCATQIASLPFLVIASNHSMLTRLAKAYHFFNTTHQNILIFPGWETLPYDHFSSHPDILSERLETLNQLPTVQQGIVITTVDAIMHPLPPKSFLQTHCLMLNKGETLAIEHFRNQLIQAGYRVVNQVYEHGELAIRGAIIDLFPMGAAYPFRLELLDNAIDTIRTFSPETQRTLQQMETIRLLPAKEFPLTEQSIEYFRKAWRNQFGGNPLQCPLYCAISEAIAPPGIEYYLPLFFEKTETLFDYLPKQMQVILTEETQTVAQTFWQTINTRYHSLCHNQTKPLIPPKQLFITPDALQTALSPYPTIILSAQTVTASISTTWQAPIQPLPTLCIVNHATDALKPLAQFIQSYSGKILFTVESEGRQEMLLRLLQSLTITPILSTSIAAFYLQSEKIGVMIAPLEEGFVL